MRTVIKLFFPILICFGDKAWAEAGEAVPQSAPDNTERRIELSVPTKWDIKGLLRTEALFYQKPSGLSGNSEFRIPYADVEILGRVADNASIDIEISHRQPVAANDKELSFTRVAAKLHPAGLDGAEASLGLIEPGAQLVHKEDWAFDNLSPELRLPAVRWGYSFESDYGLQLINRNEEFSWGIGIVNGFGAGVQSQRAQKDTFIWADIGFMNSETRRNHLTIHALRGSYENVPSMDSSKDRFMVRLATRSKEGFSFGAELWSFRDPADSISGKVADNIDLTPFGGERVKGQLFSSHGAYRWLLADQSAYEVFYRSDRLQPVSGEKDYNLTADNFGFLYSPQPGLDWVLLFSDTDYGPLHATAARDQQTWRISLSVSWD